MNLKHNWLCAFMLRSLIRLGKLIPRDAVDIMAFAGIKGHGDVQVAVFPVIHICHMFHFQQHPVFSAVAVQLYNLVPMDKIKHMSVAVQETQLLGTGKQGAAIAAIGIHPGYGLLAGDAVDHIFCTIGSERIGSVYSGMSGSGMTA